MKHPTEDVDGKPYPAPGDWSVAWAEGSVVSWRHGDDGDRIHDGPTAHVFASVEFGKPSVYNVEIDGDTVAVIEDPPSDRDALFDRIGDLLKEHEPDP